MTLDLWRLQAFVGVAMISFFFPLRFYSRIGIAGAVLWGYVLTSAAFGFMNPISAYEGLTKIRIDQSTAAAYAVSLMAPIFVLSVKPRVLIALLELFAVVESVLLLTLGFGALNNAAMDASFLAAIYPTLLFRPTRERYVGKVIAIHPTRAVYVLSIVFLPGIAIFASGSATAVFTLAAGLGLYAVLTRRYWPVLAGILALIGGALIQGPQLLNPNGRYDHWRRAMEYWLENVGFFYGSGIGTFEWVALAFQSPAKSVFLFMHNEYLQILFEGGALGFALFAAFVITVLVAARDRAWLLATCGATLFMFGTQFPLRFFVSAVFVLLLARIALEPESLEGSWPRKS